jgi:ATP-dependent protease HslVU (ClpYQ) peptidase subunit
MTTIATDGVTIAADGLAARGDEVCRQDVKKIREKDGVIYAMSGPLPIFAPLMEWHSNGAKVADVPQVHSDLEWGLLVISNAGAFEYSSRCVYPSQVEMPFTLGSGADYAMGAMHAGKTPAEAVQLVIDKCLNVHTGGRVQVINIKEALGLREPGLRVVNQKD